MVDIAHQAAINPASARDAAPARAPVPLAAIDPGQWRALAQRAVEPNGYYLPAWELAVSASARGRTNASALPAFDGSSPRLIGLMPVISLWRALKIPLPALVSAHPYGTLCSPLLDRDASLEAATRLLQQARDAGAHALVLNDVALDGAAMQSLNQVLSRDGLKPRILSSYIRASLDATQDADAMLRDALGAKKLKELRRQRHRLEEHGPVAFEVARSPDEIKLALETFLQLEASGWKGKRGTALVQHDGDAAFIRRAVPALAETAQCEIVTLRAGTTPVAAGIVLRHQDRAFFFKLGVDERFARHSPGVQLTLDLTRHLCADPAIASADSTASADHPMINPIWRGRFAIGDVLIPLRRNDPVVALIHAALVGLNAAHETARRVVRRLRK
ncbi:GNAT family N-acetyltransferase [Bradyrhizobium stylosanthis]|uniref:CelD/BcsL family acetyltransferase involved in cellulose biosynthesis n=1 Tax=Bradyrhizobium stylosanthis TaxID=1803665 RepID=A0A560DXH4_9BRAD|nr:GNAT family N-acetyltransferase [Bradyrhizobium stylosanthis]TWB01800.1 CelD/BcsL family acetyltransferase involved in cellulose biosynthesis [Bradyrhizobium stylosanthis]